MLRQPGTFSTHNRKDCQQCAKVGRPMTNALPYVQSSLCLICWSIPTHLSILLSDSMMRCQCLPKASSQLLSFCCGWFSCFALCALCQVSCCVHTNHCVDELGSTVRGSPGHICMSTCTSSAIVVTRGKYEWDLTQSLHPLPIPLYDAEQKVNIS